MIFDFRLSIRRDIEIQSTNSTRRIELQNRIEKFKSVKIVLIDFKIKTDNIRRDVARNFAPIIACVESNPGYAASNRHSQPRLKVVSTKNGEAMPFLTLEDETAPCEVEAFPDMVQHLQQPFRARETFSIAGKFTR